MLNRHEYFPRVHRAPAMIFHSQAQYECKFERGINKTSPGEGSDWIARVMPKRKKKKKKEKAGTHRRKERENGEKCTRCASARSRFNASLINRQFTLQTITVFCNARSNSAPPPTIVTSFFVASSSSDLKSFCKIYNSYIYIIQHMRMYIYSDPNLVTSSISN